ncbi:MAG TPA: RNA polymerase sigma factor [Polyangiaceae bacterium]|nr:RNA polymerase sigma factor [Polyangiaceae bacterium]
MPAQTQRPRLRAVQGGGAGDAVSDEQIIAAVQRGDSRVADELYRRLASVVDRTLYKIFGRREHDHDDIVQMAFEQVVETLARQQFAGACSLETWAARVSSHVGLNALRSRRRERQWIDRGPDVEAASDARPSVHDAERALEARSRIDQVRRHLVQMKPEQAETVFLHDALGHDLAEIALMTGASVAATQSRLVRGRKELFKRLEREDKVERREAGR